MTNATLYIMYSKLKKKIVRIQNNLDQNNQNNLYIFRNIKTKMF